jgi:hypothetical protein
MQHTTEIFDELAKTNPECLVKLVLDPKEKSSNITFAAESLSLAKPSAIILETLLTLLNNRNEMIRESAIYGLYPYYKILKVKEALAHTFNNDPSVTIRNFAKNALLKAI